MDIGVKYCGGCNVKYDRKKFLESLKKEYPFLKFHYAKENVEYNIILILCGCFSCCADYKKLKYKDKRIIVKEERDYEKVVKALNEFLT
ncbi:hypothetical protein [Maledivibacter halophilus]|uniref:4-hydroxybutyrate CoA-transferase n=1 Tax=Maledivibacter halophilus TaxID=36842 RepID=A0A1T5IAT0_9FIRM|nr:hypothetical protein [Maledivibacter halophilus]SKC36279.1 4-hydroxybutyrate CoA-transferase [Maledivibacter halophilus]